MQPFELVNALFKKRKDITSVSQLARAIHNQSFQPTLYKYLNGQTRSPDRETAERIARYFELPVDAIYDAAVASRLARDLGILEPDANRVAEPDAPAEYAVQRRTLPRATLDRIAALRPEQIEALDRIVRAYLGAPTAAPDWREVALSVAYYLEDPVRKAIINDFMARVDRKALDLASTSATNQTNTAHTVNPTSPR